MLGGIDANKVSFRNAVAALSEVEGRNPLFLKQQILADETGSE
jgi:hypothetical protein